MAVQYSKWTTRSIGFKALRTAVDDDLTKHSTHDYEGKLAWIVDRAEHYSKQLNVPAETVLDEWDKGRNYWYMNYYQDANQPELKGKVRVFDTIKDFQTSAVEPKFRCPACKGVSNDPYVCDADKCDTTKKDKDKCDWKAYGLFGTLDGGVYVFIKDVLRGDRIFNPIAWEESQVAQVLHKRLGSEGGV